MTPNPPQHVKDEVAARAGYACERCRHSGVWLSFHHRKLKQMGGSSDPTIHAATNLVLVCDRCHDEIHAHPRDSYDTGWLVHSWDDPATITPIPVADIHPRPRCSRPGDELCCDPDCPRHGSDIQNLLELRAEDAEA